MSTASGDPVHFEINVTKLNNYIFVFFHTQKLRDRESKSIYIIYKERKEKKRETNRYLEKKSHKGLVNATDCAAATRSLGRTGCLGVL
jgi:hypothetical protein